MLLSRLKALCDQLCAQHRCLYHVSHQRRSPSQQHGKRMPHIAVLQSAFFLGDFCHWETAISGERTSRHVSGSGSFLTISTPWTSNTTPRCNVLYTLLNHSSPRKSCEDVFNRERHLAPPSKDAAALQESDLQACQFDRLAESLRMDCRGL